MAAGSATWISPTIQTSHQARLVTIAGAPGDDLAAGTLTSVLKQSGLRP